MKVIDVYQNNNIVYIKINMLDPYVLWSIGVLKVSAFLQTLEY